jgi:hypothetical protein
MLSREHVIHRSAGEERHAAVRRDGKSDEAGVVLKAGLWAKLVLLAAIVSLLAAFLLLNRGSVVEPRVHLVFTRYERPSLLVVMLLTAAFSAAAALLLRGAFGTMRQLRSVRARPSDAPSRRAAVDPAPALARAASSL